MPDDTQPAARAFQVALLRASTVARRFARARSLTQSTLALAWRAVRRAHPDADEEGLAYEFLRVHYGRELAARWRQFRRR